MKPTRSSWTEAPWDDPRSAERKTNVRDGIVRAIPPAEVAGRCAPGLQHNLHEDLAQTLCAIKFYLEGLSQNELPGAHIASSIAALQSAIRQLSSLAVRADPPSLPAPTRPFHKRRYPAFLETRPGGI